MVPLSHLRRREAGLVDTRISGLVLLKAPSISRAVSEGCLRL
jgi:hypothetical protein